MSLGCSDKSISVSFSACTTSGNNSVGILTKLRAGRSRNRGSISSSSKRFFAFPKRRNGLWCPSSLSTVNPVNQHCGIFLRVEQPGREANKLIQSSTDISTVRLYLHSFTRLRDLPRGQPYFTSPASSGFVINFTIIILHFLLRGFP